MRTTQQLLEKIQKENLGLYNQVMLLRDCYVDIIDLTRKEAKELQQRTLNIMYKTEGLEQRTTGIKIPSKTLYRIR